MAKRKRIDVPSDAELREMEAVFDATAPGPRSAPIAQIAAESAALSQPLSPDDRARSAKDSADADRLRTAEADGRLIIDVPISEIRIRELARDREIIGQEAMDELKASIAAHGVRSAIEVMRLAEGGYGLISGYRRVMAAKEVHGSEASIPAIVRASMDAADAYVSMIEENEIRDNLSLYERGRIAVVAAGQGAFADTAEAVGILFAAGSKAKRSKIRSFATIHEELGDLLAFGYALSERAGLRLAAALKTGHGAAIRSALADADPESAAAEWRVLAAVLDRVEGKQKPKPARDLGQTHPLAEGVTMTRERDRFGYAIRLDGPEVDEAFVESVMLQLQRLMPKK